MWGVCPGRAGGLIPCSVEDDPVALSFVIIPAVFEDVLVVSGVPPPPPPPRFLSAASACGFPLLVLCGEHWEPKTLGATPSRGRPSECWLLSPPRPHICPQLCSVRPAVHPRALSVNLLVTSRHVLWVRLQLRQDSQASRFCFLKHVKRVGPASGPASV